MSASYPPPGNNYAVHHPNIHGPNQGRDDPDALSAHHHNLPQAQSYAAYDQHPPPPPQHQSPYSNGHANGLNGQSVSSGHMNDAQQGASASASGGDGAKANRLRKACDLCSQRKVKVCYILSAAYFNPNVLQILTTFPLSATSQDLHVELAPLWMSNAPSNDPVDDEVPQINMPKQQRRGKD
jgi:hypothetical protein